MTTKLVIIGLPTSGKTTVFNALTASEASTGGFTSKDDINLATVKVPDERLDQLTEMFNPQRRVPADIQYLDVGSLGSGLSEQGLSGELLGQLSQADALIVVVRAFEDDGVPHPGAGVDPIQDIEQVLIELSFSDLAIIEKRLERLSQQIPKLKGAEREVNEREQKLMERLKKELEAEIPIREVIPEISPDDLKMLRGYGFLTAKPLLILINLGEAQLQETGAALVTEATQKFVRPGIAIEALAGEIEMEIAQLDTDDARTFLDDLGIEQASRERVIRTSFDLLGLMPFFTVGPDECRAWTIAEGTSAVDAAAEIHSDIQRGFIRAEVVSYEDMIEAGSMAETKRLGKFRREGKSYIVQDGDIINFLFNV